MIDTFEPQYRPSTLALVHDRDGNFLVVNKLNYQPDQWSFPGGGVETDETPEEAIERELKEEILSDHYKVVGKSSFTYRYDWPESVREKAYKTSGKNYQGTELTQFWVLFTGLPNEPKPGDGIREVKWIKKDELEKYLTFPNQYENAMKVINEFINL